MTAEAFVKAVREMKGLRPPMADSLAAMADALTEEERADTVKKLQPIGDEITKNEGEAIEAAKSATEEIRALRRTELPKVRKLQEEQERAAGAKEAEERLGAS